MHCDYYAAGHCRSCAIIETPYSRQLADKQKRVSEAVPTLWLDPVASAEIGFRTKAKMVVAGSTAAPTLGILDPGGRGQDLQSCGLYPASLSRAFAPLTAFITRAGLVPYSVPERSGELKSIVVTVSPDDELMIRFVMRSTEALARIRKHLPWLHQQLPGLTVVTLNVLAEHAALPEGDREIVLTDVDTLRMRVNGIDLHLGPRSFFQTNTTVAAALYREVRAWVGELAPASAWDLYCGVGGFALHTAGEGRSVTGVEASAPATEAARRSAAELGVSIDLIAADATAWAAAQPTPPDVVIINPPRRGVGQHLATWLEESGVPAVIYSSCNPDTLATDLAHMPSMRPVRGRLFDMFPHTDHAEAAVLLERA